MKVQIDSKYFEHKAKQDVERLINRVSVAHDRARKERTSENVVDKINEENRLFDLLTVLYTHRNQIIKLGNP